MQFRGSHISNWWLLLPGVLIVICSPLLLIGFFSANNLAGAIIGPPAIWNRPSHLPPRKEVVGDYVESKRQLDREMGTQLAWLSLKADGTMAVYGLPVDQYPGYCILSGEGRWGLQGLDHLGNVDINVLTANAANTCKAGDYSDIELVGRSIPYKLYWIVGDPDSGTGVWLVRR